MTLLEMDAVSVERGRTPVLSDVTLSIGAGELVGLIGPNGAGKTTLMRAALGLLPHSGVSSLDALPPNLRARQVAWLPQTRQITWPVTVETVVALGRIPHLPTGRRLSPKDQTAVDMALARMDLSALRDRVATDLSGGEQARVLIARTLAQEARLVVADEPIAGLDPAAQISTMQVFKHHAMNGGAVLVSLHDLGLAARHCTRLILLDRGRVVADGSADSVLTDAHLRRVFGVSGQFADTPAGRVFQPGEVG